MKFFDSFWKASFYKGGKATSFWRSFGKVTLVTFILSIIYSIVFYVSFGMHIPAHLYSYGIQALNGYPSNLVVTIEDDRLSKNIAGELHLYPIPEGRVGDVMMEDVLPGYIIAINDKESVSLESYDRANALILLAKDGLVVQGDREIQMMSYKDLMQSQDTFVFTKDMIVGVVETVNKYAEKVPGIIIVAIIVSLTLLVPLGYLLLGLLHGLLIMWLSKYIIGKKRNFSESYILGMYALAPVIIVSELLRVTPYIQKVVNLMPFFTTLLVIIFIGYMFRTTTSNDTASVDETTS